MPRDGPPPRGGVWLAELGGRGQEPLARLGAGRPEEGRDPQHHRRRGQPAAHQGDDRRVRPIAPEGHQEGHLHDRHRARAARQDPGAAERRSGADRPRSHRHGRLVGRHQPEAVGQDRRLREPSRQRELPAARRRRCRSWRRARASRSSTTRPGRCIEYNPKTVPNPPTTTAGAARLGQGAPEEVPVRPPRQLRPRPYLPDGPALPSRRHEPEGPQGRLDQDLGLPPGARASTSTTTRRRRRR